LPYINATTSIKSNDNILLYVILITIKVSKMTKFTSQALYKKNIEIRKKKKKIN